MRLLLLILFTSILFCLIATGQTIKNYKFTYKLNLDKPPDTARLLIDTIKNDSISPTIKATIKNSQSEPISGLTVIFKSTYATLTTITDEHGMFSVKGVPADYNLIVSGAGYQTFDKQINVDKNNSLHLSIILARTALLNWYIIHSIKKLSQSDISNIKNCIQSNEPSFNKCKKKDEYYLTSEI